MGHSDYPGLKAGLVRADHVSESARDPVGVRLPVIDLDQLERKLEEATTDEVRALRASGRPAATPAVPATPEHPVGERAHLVSPPERAEAASSPIYHASLPRSVPPGPVADRKAGHRARRARPTTPCEADPTISELLETGRVADACEAIAAHAATTRDSGSPTDRWDAAAWATTLALLDGRAADARGGLDSVLALGQEAQAAGARERWWSQRFWVVVDTGTEAEWCEMLDHCRERAYRHDDPRWWSRLTLMLSHLGMAEEAVRAYDSTVAKALEERAVDGPERLNVAASLAEAAARLGDRARAEHSYRVLKGEPAHRMVLCREGFVLRGAVARFQGLAAAMTGRTEESDNAFRTAVSVHRAIRAEPLLARAMHEWSRSLAGRDDMRAAGLGGEAAGIAARTGLRSL